MKNSRIKNGIMRIVQGIIIGAGAILPGISGGVLAVVSASSVEARVWGA